MSDKLFGINIVILTVTAHMLYKTKKKIENDFSKQ